MDSTSISDKEQMLNCFNKHFVASGFLFESQNFVCSDFINAESRLKRMNLDLNKLRVLMFIKHSNCLTQTNHQALMVWNLFI